MNGTNQVQHADSDSCLVVSSEKSSFTYRSILNSVAAGYCAGISGTIVGHPLDSMKVWLQTANYNTNSTSNNSSQSITTGKNTATSVNPPTSRGTPTTTTTALPGIATRAASTLVVPSNVNITNNVQQIVTGMKSNHSNPSTLQQIRSLYAGVTGPLLTVGIIQSVNFALYDSIRRVLYAIDHPTDDYKVRNSEYLYCDSYFNVACSSMAAGVVISIITNPLALVKTRQQTAIRNGTNLGFIEAFRQINKRGGTTELFRGFKPHFIAEVYGRGIYFVTYEYMKRQFAQRHARNFPTDTIDENQQQQQQRFYQCTLPERMISAAVSGIICWASIYPVDAVRSRIYALTHHNTPNQGGQETERIISTRQMIQTMYNTGGWRNFFRGFWITIIRAGPVAAFVLPVYDISLEQISQL